MKTFRNNNQIEELETRIDLLKQDSRMRSYRIDYHRKERAKIQAQIKRSKEQIKKLQSKSKKTYGR
jgi:predicted  nucleic acid-binding Zn-ribbon protein